MSSTDRPAEPADPIAAYEDSVNKPGVARIYDWFLGGAHNWAIDQRFGKQIEAILPDVKMYALENRKFLTRAVRYCANLGIEQYVDIGSGLPTRGNVHEIAEEILPGQARVVYIDKDFVAHAHAVRILGDNGDPDRHHAVHADLLREEELWERVMNTGVIDPHKPIALLMVAVLHFVKDSAGPHEKLAYYRDQLPAGSALVMSHFTGDECDTLEEQDALHQLVELYEKSTDPGQLRSRNEFSQFFGDLPLVEPGVVYAPEWRPDEGQPQFDRPSTARILAAVARK